MICCFHSLILKGPKIRIEESPSLQIEPFFSCSTFNDWSLVFEWICVNHFSPGVPQGPGNFESLLGFGKRLLWWFPSEEPTIPD